MKNKNCLNRILLLWDYRTLKGLSFSFETLAYSKGWWNITNLFKAIVVFLMNSLSGALKVSQNKYFVSWISYRFYYLEQRRLFCVWSNYMKNKNYLNRLLHSVYPYIFPLFYALCISMSKSLSYVSEMIVCHAIYQSVISKIWKRTVEFLLERVYLR